MEDILSKKHLVELSAEIENFLKKNNWFSIYGMEIFKTFLRFIAFGFGFFIFGVEGVFYKIIGITIMSYFYYAITISGTHESSHQSFVRSKIGNKVWAYFFTDFWSAQSSLWWYDRHVVKHHANTNVGGKDGANFVYPWLNKYLYFFVVPYFANFWLLVNSIKYLHKNIFDLSIYLMLQSLGWIFHIYLFTFYLSLPYAVLAAFVMRALFAPIFMHMAVFNHIGLDMPKDNLPWIMHQTKTTRNLRKNWFLSSMGGNAFVECHLEHHLFPKMSNSVLSKIRPIVQKYMKKENYHYIEEGYFQCLKNCLKNYKSFFGKMSGLI